jgi:hypothetical protein
VTTVVGACTARPEDALDRFESEGEIEISVESVGHRSAFVGAVLLQLPGALVIDGTSPPRLRLSRRPAV